MPFIAQWISETVRVVLEVAPWLVAGFLLAGVIHVLIPVDMISRHLGSPGWREVVKASLLGIPLPLCSCSVIPVATTLRRHGASKGATAGFLISTPETGIDSIAMSYALLGPFLAIARPVSALVTSIVAGCLVNRFDKQKSPNPGNASPAADGCCTHSDGGSGGAQRVGPSATGGGRYGGGRQTLGTRFSTAIRYGFVDMFTDLSHWLILGFVLAGLIAAAIPEGFLGRQIGSGIGPMLLMLVVGLPVYVCATSSTPVAAALIAAGLSPGAALVFLLAGPASNIGTMGIIARELGRVSLACYIISIAVVSVLCGVVTDALLVSSSPTIPPTGVHHHMLPSFVLVPSAVILVVLMLNGLRLRIQKRAMRECGMRKAE